MSTNTGAIIKERTLLYLPIVHTYNELGGMGDHVRRATLRRLGREGWQRKVHLIQHMWTEIAQVINKLDLSHQAVRVYQDGLPVCGREVDIVKELAQAGSTNHRLLLGLIDRGALLMGTESAELLVQEYQLVRHAVSEVGAKFSSRDQQNRQDSLYASILQKRDEFIAQRINTTLLSGETGIVFLGILHSLAPWLEPNIQVIYPLRLPWSMGGKSRNGQK